MPRSGRWAACLGLLVALSASAVMGADRAASTSAAERDAARRAIPYSRLVPSVADKIRQVVKRPTLYRRMPIQTTPCDPDFYVFLVRYPEVVVNMWQLMGVTKVQIQRTGAHSFDASDGAGMTCNVELVYGTRNLHIVYAEGAYKGPLLKRRVTGRCVLVLSSAYSEDQPTQVTNRLDVFMQVDNLGVDLVARTLSPLMGKTADKNFTQSATFLGQVCQVAATNGPGIQQLATKLKNIDPAVRQKFSDLAAAANHRALLAQEAWKKTETATVSDQTVSGQATVDTSPRGALKPLMSPERPHRGAMLRRD